MRAIHWTDEALDQVLRIKEYLAVTSPESAERVVQNIINKAEQLIQFPKSGPVYAKAGLPQVRELLVRPHKLIYELTTTQIRIMAVLHQSQN